MKRIAVVLGVMLSVFPMFAQSTISFSAEYNFNGGHEVALESENFFRSGHSYSLYGLFDYHFAEEEWLGEAIDCKKAMAEVGVKKFFQVIENKIYPYVGLGMTAGIQNMYQSTNRDRSIIDEDTDPFLLGGTATIGSEFMLSDRMAFRISCRLKYDDFMHYVLGGGLTFSL